MIMTLTTGMLQSVDGEKWLKLYDPAVRVAALKEVFIVLLSAQADPVTVTISGQTSEVQFSTIIPAGEIKAAVTTDQKYYFTPGEWLKVYPSIPVFFTATLTLNYAVGIGQTIPD